MSRSRNGRGIVGRRLARFMLLISYATWAVAMGASIFAGDNPRAMYAAINTACTGAVIWCAAITIRILWRKRT